MLTNDDGWAAQGITTVFDALVAAGHDVTMVAPLANNSGMGGRITLGGTLAVTQPAPRKYAVDGTPSDAAEFGINTVFAGDPPDLVISGTNKGQNLASLQIHSGTVAAAATALNDGIPAIAISTGWDYADPHADPNSFPYDYTADYLLQLLDRLRATAHPGGPLLPDGVGLNVNYPYVNGGHDRARGVKVLDSGSGYADLTYAGAALPAVGGRSTYTVGADLFDSVERDADDVWFRRGYVTITPITGNYDAELAVGSAERLRNSLD
ncbi:5'/3'-nucleotidase SurE [Nocardioides kongjuensis]|uniref:5'-nucleotidase n=1 Tax=Nocardioides kongjuensis TaxID=349522 RepID=A0A852RM31_9ACTN|nr:5'/3'-nucleotidase SurE [Nocardioides kongjuensis]NYD29094.1 5'-nucleotidase [Nocardioides kongjuensis]